MKYLPAIILAVIGMTLLIWSLPMPAYSNHDEFHRAYLSIDYTGMDPVDRSNAFYNLREQYQTSKFKLEDYGFTFLSLGLICLLLRNGRETRLFSSKLLIASVGVLAAVSLTVSETGSLFMDYYRGEFPHWADSLGIPLAGMSIMGFIFVMWALVHCLYLISDFCGVRTIDKIKFEYRNIWLFIVSGATFLIFLHSSVYGYFWSVLPSFLWIVFYFNLMTNKGADQCITKR